MALLLALALFAVAWFLFDAGMEFFAMLAIVGGILVLIMDTSNKRTSSHHKSPSSSPGYYPPPVIVRSSPSPPVQAIKMRIKQPWSGTTNVEDFFSNMSEVFLFPIKIIWRLFRGR